MGKEKKEGMKYPKRFVEMCSGLYMKLYTKKIQLKLRRYRYFDFFFASWQSTHKSWVIS